MNIFTLVRKISLLLTVSILLITGANAQISVTATAGTLGPTTYTTLGLAFTAINAGTHKGVISVSVTANTTETAQCVLNASGSGSASYTSVTVKPSTGTTATISGAIASNSLIKILGNNVTIDGSNASGGTTQNLTITNTSTNTPYVIWLGSTGTTPITGTTLKNCIVINGVNTAVAVVVSDGTTLGNAGYSNNITIQNNSIQKAYDAIYAIATATGTNGNGMLITGNQMNTSGANAIYFQGIFIEGYYGATISNNTIGNFVTNSTVAAVGIDIYTGTTNSSISGNTISSITNTGGSTHSYYPTGIMLYPGTATANLTVTGNTISGLTTSSATGTTNAVSGILVGNNAAAGGITISGNNISNISSTSTGGYGANGIQLYSTTTAANINVYNNYISGVYAYGYASATANDNGYGIVVSSGGGYNIRFNTILNQTNQTSTTGIPACICVAFAAAASSLDVRDNILDNTQTVGSRYCIYSAAAATAYSTIDYNDYYIGSASGTYGLGYLTSARTTLAAMITGFGANANSINFAPVFIGAPNLGLTSADGTLKAGVAISGITTDINGVTRCTPPYIGAEEADVLTAGTLATFGTGDCIGNTYGPNSFTISGTGLTTANVTVGPLTDFTFSTTSGGTYTSSLSLSQSGGCYSQTIYVELTPSSATTYTGQTISVSGGGATATSTTIQSTTSVSCTSPVLTGGSLASFGSVCVGNTGGPNSFTISGAVLTTANITVGPLTGFTFSTTSGGTYTSSLSLSQPGGTYSQTIYVEFNPTSATSYSGNIPVGGGGASSINVAVTATGVAIPTITLGANPSACYSASSQTVNLSYSATGSSPTTYSISGWSGGSFANVTNATLPATPIGITVPAATIAATYTANLTVTNAGCSSSNYPISVTVNAVPTAVTVTPPSAGLCSGSVVLTASGGSPGTIYWQNTTSGGTSTSLGGSPQTVTSSGTYYFNAVNAGCWGTQGSSTVGAPGLNGTYTVGTGGTYTTLTAAVAAYNAGAICGPVVFNLIQATYSGSETFPIVINNNLGANSTNTLTIEPASGVTATITGNSATSLIELNSANWVTINGAQGGVGSTQALTIDNTNTAGSSSNIVVGSSSSTGCSNDIIENCILPMGGTGWFDVWVGNTAIGTAGTIANTNIQVLNNTITGASYGAAFDGPAAGESGNVVTGNYIGGATAATELEYAGVFFVDETGGTISGNTITGAVTTNAGGYNCGIQYVSSNCNIFGNQISNINNPSSTGASCGILLGSGSSTASTNVYNNYIWDIIAHGSGTSIIENGNGIDIASGSGYNIYFNSISMNTNQTHAEISCGIFVASGGTPAAANINLENNIISNTETTGTTYGLYSAYNNIFTTMDYNDYYVSSGTNYADYNGTNYATIGAIATAFGNNTHSGIIAPNFVSTSDLDLKNYNNFCLASGTAISGITTDIHGTTRVVPVIGADEINYTFSSTAAASACSGSGTTVTVTAPASTLAAGTYTVTYSLSAPNALGSSTATMMYVAGTTNAGTFTIPAAQLATAGATTITITAIQPATACAANFSAKALPVTNVAADQAIINVVQTPSGGTIAPLEYCTTVGSGSLSITGVSDATQYAWSVPSGLSLSSSGILLTLTTSVPNATVYGTTGGPYTVTVTPQDGASGVTCSAATPVTGTVTIDPLLVPSVTLSEAPNDTVITYGLSVTFTATPTNGGTSPTYDFYVGTTLVQSGTSNTYTTSTLAVGNDSVKCIMASSASCLTTTTATSNTIRIKVDSGINTWTGAVSNVWTNPSNWTNDVPTCSLDGLIPQNLTTYPVITTSVSIRNLTIQADAYVTMSSAGTLSVCGNVSAASAQSWSGSVILQGTGAQTLSAGSTISMGNLEVNGNYTISSGQISVAGILNKAGGTLNTNNNLILTANSAQTALIAENGGSLAGDVTMQQYVHGNTGYHHISSPMTSSTLGNLSGIFITGTNGVGSFVHNEEGTIETYSEAGNAHAETDSGYYNYTSLSNPLTPGVGYTALFYPPATLGTYGSPNNGAVSVTVTNTAGHAAGVEGWNFVGNPYPSPISWSAVKTLNSGLAINGSCYIWVASTPTSGTWTGYNGTAGTGGVGNVIASSQGFWVDVTSAGSHTLNFSNAVRTQDLSPMFYKAPDMLANELRLNISSASDAGSEALMYTEATGESSAAIPPMQSFITSPTITYMNADNNEHDMIYVASSIDENTEIPLAIHIGAAGSYTISALSINVSGMPVYILDKATGTYYDMSSQTVTINSQGNDNINGRYSVVYNRKTKAAAANTVNIYGKSAAIEVERMNGDDPAQVIVTDMLGREVANRTAPGSSIEIPVADAYAIYMVTVISGDIRTIKKVIVKE